jgi:hypothetical protein
MITTIFFEQRFDSGFARGGRDLEQTAHLVLDISSKVDQLGACRQQRKCISNLRAFDVCFAAKQSILTSLISTASVLTPCGSLTFD